MKKLRRLRVLHRPDGVIELRRRRLRDSAVMQDVAVLLALCVGCVAFIAALATIIVKTPGVLAATAALAVPIIPAVLIARSAELAPATASRSGRRSPDPAA